LFTDNPNLKQVADKIWIYKGFNSKEDNKRIIKAMENHQKQFENTSDAFLQDEHVIDWYKDKTGPIIPELKPIWDQVSTLLYPEYYIHPQLFMQVMRPGDEGMFVHADSPGINMEDDLTQNDRWDTCCILSWGVVSYFGEFEGGEVFYPNIEKDGTVKNRPGDIYDCLEVKVEPGDLVIHGACHPYEHGVREISSGIRFAFSNFSMAKDFAPGTFELFNPDKHPHIKERQELWDWVGTVYPKGTFQKRKCVCGRSKDFPYCDNTHKSLPLDERVREDLI
jgi:hypothetical protein